MPKKARVVLLILVVAIGFGVWRWRSGNGDSGALTASGTIEATELDLSPRIGGRILQISVDEGAKVTKGQVIATLSAPEVEARVAQAKGALAAAEARLADLEKGTRKEQIASGQARFEAARKSAESNMAVLWFKVPIAGSVLLLFALTIVFLATSLGLGLLVSTVSHTQQQAMMTSFFVIQPSIMLSGFMFPIESMPRAIQIITYAIPLRYFVEIIRGIFLRGVGLEVLWPQALLLFVLGALLLGASVVRFTKKVG